MINNEPADHPPPDHVRVIEIPPKSCFPIFIILLVIYLAFTYNIKRPAAFTYKPERPIVTIDRVQISDYTLSSISSTVSFKFTLHTTIESFSNNPITYEAQLFYANQQIGFQPLFSNIMTVRAKVSMYAVNVPLSVFDYIPAKFGIAKMGSTMELDVKVEMRITGRRRTVLRLLGHQVDNSVECQVTISVFDGSVQSLHC